MCLWNDHFYWAIIWPSLVWNENASVIQSLWLIKMSYQSQQSFRLCNLNKVNCNVKCCDISNRLCYRNWKRGNCECRCDLTEICKRTRAHMRISVTSKISNNRGLCWHMDSESVNKDDKTPLNPYWVNQEATNIPTKTFLQLLQFQYIWKANKIHFWGLVKTLPLAWYVL